ncbi:MAG: hypothetical protein WCQ16_07415 [Verrucomicrobiae bacterium]
MPHLADAIWQTAYSLTLLFRWADSSFSMDASGALAEPALSAALAVPLAKASNQTQSGRVIFFSRDLQRTPVA